MTTDQKYLLELVKRLAFELKQARQDVAGKIEDETLEDVEFTQETVSLLAQNLEQRFSVSQAG